MASYDNFDPYEDIGGWCVDVTNPSAVCTSEFSNQYLTDAESYYDQQPGPETLLQVYDVRSTEWNTMPTETPGAYDLGVTPYWQGYQVHHSSFQGFQKDGSELPAASNWPTNYAMPWASSQASPQRPATSPQPVSARPSRDYAEVDHARRRTLSAAQDSGAETQSRAFQYTAMPTTSTDSRTDPSSCEDGLVPRRQDPRFAGDQYTARWIRGDRNDRAGYCGLCSSWHKLKDSAYWYHMHYQHGISCVTGKPFDSPIARRSAQGSVGHEALCGTCNQWVLVGRGDRWRTPFFRHAYKCQVKNNPNVQRTHSRSKSGSPRKHAVRPTGFR